MGHSAGAYKTLEMLDGMFDSFDHPEQSSTEQGRRKGKQSYTLLNEMLDSFDQVHTKGKTLTKNLVFAKKYLNSCICSIKK